MQELGPEKGERKGFSFFSLTPKTKGQRDLSKTWDSQLFMPARFFVTPFFPVPQEVTGRWGGTVSYGFKTCLLSTSP